jgi:hypothetical protein
MITLHVIIESLSTTQDLLQMNLLLEILQSIYQTKKGRETY